MRYRTPIVTAFLLLTWLATLPPVGQSAELACTRTELYRYAMPQRLARLRAPYFTRSGVPGRIFLPSSLSGAD